MLFFTTVGEITFFNFYYNVNLIEFAFYFISIFNLNLCK